jgi:hypothetical protein
MKRKHWIFISGALLLAAASSTIQAYEDTGRVPQAIHLREVRPPEGIVGDVLIAHGDNLNASRVKELWLTNGQNDYKLEILEQGDHSIRFRLPDWVPAGRWRLMVLSNEDVLLEQPAYVKVRDVRGPSITG